MVAHGRRKLSGIEKLGIVIFVPVIVFLVAGFGYIYLRGDATIQPDKVDFRAQVVFDHGRVTQVNFY